MKRDAYNIEGYRLRMQMRNKAAENTETRYLEALRAFDKLRTDYAASTHFIEAIPEALAILGKFDTQLAAMVTDSAVLIKQRQDGLKSLTGSDAQITKKSIEDEERAHKMAVDQQFKTKVKWRDIYKYDSKGLLDERQTVSKEITELTALTKDMDALRTESGSYLAAIRYLADGNLTEADSVLSAAAKQPNILNKPLLYSLRKELDTKKVAAQKAKKTATGNSGAAAAATTEDPASVASNPVAEAMKKIQEEKEKKAAEAAKSGDKKAGSTTAGKTKTDGAKGDKPAADGAKPAATPATAAPQEESLVDKIVEYIPFIGGGLLVVLLAAFFMSKKKKKDE